MSSDLPMDMPAHVAALWRKVYLASRRIWVGKLEDYFDEDAKLTANVAVVGWWSQRRGQWYPRTHTAFGKMPEAGPLFELGDFHGVETVSKLGAIVTHDLTPSAGERRPKLLWSQDLKACFVFPFMKPGACSLEVPAREARLISMWNKGRQAKCAAPADYPRATFGPAHPGISISYRSDKFSHGTPKDYIHHFEGDVMVYISVDATSGVPRAIMVKGGKLHVTPHGLEG